ncbi:unnamed protein product [Parnassius apollo]|uniref:(apollo) hypothetical protein n=1 Tax=Parnassius apollo TaxID=110799 RepID=A0A8S3WYU0_PARAO|nr:unnamed protein product [Parnassius apollo]
MSKWQSERSIHEMLKDTPPLRESSDSITSGTEAKFPTSRSMPFPPAYAPPDVSQNGAAGTSTLLRSGSTKLESLKNWGVSTYKCTKQLLYEKLGKSSRTVDTELEVKIEALRETQRRYNGVLRLTTALAAQMTAASHTQRALADAFADLAQKSPELQNQFLYNADTQRSLTRNGDILLAALHFFNNSLNTLTNKTIEDTLLTIRQYEAARVEYDAYRSELEASGGNPPELLLASIERHRRHYERLRDDSAVKLQLLHENRVRAPPYTPTLYPPVTRPSCCVTTLPSKLQLLHENRVRAPPYTPTLYPPATRPSCCGNPPELLLASIERHRRHYERLRDDSAVKLQLLHENRVKVMNKQLLLFHNAVSAYFSGNNVALEAAVRHFSVPAPPHATSHATPHATSLNTPHATSLATPHATSLATPHATSHATPHATPHATSHATPHAPPLATPPS